MDRRAMPLFHMASILLDSGSDSLANILDQRPRSSVELTGSGSLFIGCEERMTHVMIFVLLLRRESISVS